MERRRRLVLGVLAVALVAINAPRPSANVRLDFAEAADVSVPRAEAAVELGALGVKILVTWGAKQLR